MTDAYQELVENNMGLVADVIKRCIENPNRISGYTYQDLYQIGCVGLCKAAGSYVPGKSRFSTFASVVIRNEIFMALEHATIGNKRVSFVDMSEMNNLGSTNIPESTFELFDAVAAAGQSATGITAKGVRAIQLMADGYSCKEIGEMMNAPANHVTAWISRARKYLAKNPAIAAFSH